MLNKININPRKQKLIVYIVLTLVTLAVFWQVNRYDFINIDDNVYVTGNSHIQSGITLDGFRWAFSYHLCRILASFDMAVIDVRLSTSWPECRRLSCDQPYSAYIERSAAVLAF